MNDKDRAYWLADKIVAVAYHDYTKEAALVLRKQADEIERLRIDAERYRRLCWLIRLSHWSVRRYYGLSPNIVSKDDLDKMLDDTDVIAEASGIAERHSVTEME